MIHFLNAFHNRKSSMFPGLYLNNDVTCQKMRTRFCNLTIKDSKNVNLKVPAQNQKRRKTRRVQSRQVSKTTPPLRCF